MRSFKAPGVARPMQSCDGFAEAALRLYLIKATEQGSRAATSQLKWLLSGRPPSLSDNAHHTTHSGWARQPGRTLRGWKCRLRTRPDSRLSYLIKAGAVHTLGACGPVPKSTGPDHRRPIEECEQNKQPHFGRPPRPLTGALQRVSIQVTGGQPTKKTAAAWE
jgi:hypothetical protein